MKTILKMGLLTYFLCFLAFVGGGSFLIKDFLNLFGAPVQVYEKAIEITYMMIPAMFLRGVNDIFKSFYSCQDHYDLLGSLYTINFFLFYSYSFMIVGPMFNLGLIGYALSITIGELGAFLVSMYFYYRKMKSKIRNCKTRTSVFRNLPWFIIESAKCSLVQVPAWIVYDSILYFISRTHNNIQISIFTILTSLECGLTLCLFGLVSYCISRINFQLGIKDFKAALDLSRYYFIVNSFVVLVLVAIIEGFLFVGSFFCSKEAMNEFEKILVIFPLYLWQFIVLGYVY